MQTMDSEGLADQEAYDLRRMSAETKRMLFYASPDGESTFSRLLKHHLITLNDQASRGQKMEPAE